MATLVLIADGQAALIAGGGGHKKCCSKTVTRIDIKNKICQTAYQGDFGGDLTQVASIDLSLNV